MAIFINVYQDKRKNSNKLFYGRAMHPQTIDTRALAKRIEKNVSVKESDVYAVLIELAEVMTYELANSNKVQLDRFGYFYPSITSTAHKLCPPACGIFREQGMNSCSLHWHR